jgi:hypothetical protein
MKILGWMVLYPYESLWIPMNPYESLWIPSNRFPPISNTPQKCGCRGYSGCSLLGGMGLVTRCLFDKECITWTMVKMRVEAPGQLCFNCLHWVFTSKFSRFIPPKCSWNLAKGVTNTQKWPADLWMLGSWIFTKTIPLLFHLILVGWNGIPSKKMDDDRHQVFKG